MRPAFWRKVVTFGLVGVGASLVHIVVAWAVIQFGQAPVIIANVAGFCIAFIWSYLGHYHLTFRASNTHSAAFSKFAVVALGGFAVNTGVVLAWQAFFGAGSIWAIILGVILAAGAVFVASSRWAFGAARD